MAMNEQALFQDVRRYLAMLHKRRAILVTCVLVSLLLAVLYNYTTRPIYQATAQILIDRDTPNVLMSKEIVDLVQSGSDYLPDPVSAPPRSQAGGGGRRGPQLQKSPEFLTGPLMSPWERIQRRFLGGAPAAAMDTDGMPLLPPCRCSRRLPVASDRRARGG